MTRPDQVWVADITYVRLREEFVYLAILMDVFTRLVRGWELGRGLDQGLTLAALRRAMRRGRRPEVHHSDQGVPYAAAYTDLLAGRGVSISIPSEPSSPKSTPHVSTPIPSITRLRSRTAAMAC